MATLLCPRCQRSNAPDARFCYACGTGLATPEPQTETSSLRKVCLGCGTVNEMAFRYCYRCGLSLPQEALIPSDALGDPAGFWVRLLAYLIDAALLLVVGVVATAVLTGEGTEQVVEELLGLTETDWRAAVITELVGVAYYTFAIGRWGRTAGKLALGLKVVRTDGTPLTYARSFARYWAYYLAILPLGLGVLAVALSPRKRGWHDRVCDTQVLRVRS